MPKKPKLKNVLSTDIEWDEISIKWTDKNFERIRSLSLMSWSQLHPEKKLDILQFHNDFPEEELLDNLFAQGLTPEAIEEENDAYWEDYRRKKKRKELVQLKLKLGALRKQEAKSCATNKVKAKQEQKKSVISIDDEVDSDSDSDTESDKKDDLILSKVKSNLNQYLKDECGEIDTTDITTIFNLKSCAILYQEHLTQLQNIIKEIKTNK